MYTSDNFTKGDRVTLTFPEHTTGEVVLQSIDNYGVTIQWPGGAVTFYPFHSFDSMSLTAKGARR